MKKFIVTSNFEHNSIVGEVLIDEDLEKKLKTGKYFISVGYIEWSKKEKNELIELSLVEVKNYKKIKI